jgi:hypothetical protein
MPCIQLELKQVTVVSILLMQWISHRPYSVKSGVAKIAHIRSSPSSTESIVCTSNAHKCNRFCRVRYIFISDKKAEISQSVKWLAYLLTHSMVQDIIWKADCHSACQKTSWFLMEPEGSLPCSHKPAIGPYPEPAESSLTHRSLSP